MTTKLLLLAVSVAAFSSCSTMYKTGQTPDDVYYSPLRPAAVAQKVEKEEVKNDQANYYNSDDRIIRMGIYDSRWRYLNNDFGYSPYYHTFYNSYSYSNNFYMPVYSKFYYNDYYYNPFYSYAPVYITSVKPIRNTTPRTTNLAGYSKNYNNTNYAPLNYVPGVKSAAKSNNGNTGILGKILDNVLSPAPSYNNRNSNSTSNSTSTDASSPTRTYTPAPSSSSSSSSGSGSSGGRITRSK